MNILCFLSGSYMSGKEFVGLDVVEGWKNAGHKVHVAFMGWHDGKMLARLNEMGVPAHPIKLGWYYLTKFKWSLDSLLHYPSAVRDYKKAQSLANPDVIYVDSYRQVVLLLPFLRRRVLFHVHDPHSQSKLEKRILNIADKKIVQYLAVSNYIKKDLVDSGIDENKITVIHNGTPIPQDFGKKYIPDGILRIGIVGQIISRKGHEDVMKACAMIKGEIPFQLCIYGTGDEKYIQQLKSTITDLELKDNVIWKGFESDKEKLYGDLDIVVAATRNDEPFALVALEAGSYKVPIIATASGGFPEAIIDGETGYIIPKNDIRAIANKITELYKNSALLSRMGDAAYKHICENFSIETMRQKMCRVLTNVNS